MVKKILLSLVIFSSTLCSDVYEENCVACHKSLPVSIDKYFYKYLLIYSGEVNMKYAIINYLKVPVKETSVMSDAFLSRFGVKKKSKLSDVELEEAVNIYWEKYKVFGKLQ